MLFNPLKMVFFLLFLCMRKLFLKIQAIMWKTNGIQGKLQKSHTTKGYEECVHIQDIWLKYAFSDVFPPPSDGFIAVNKMFTHPDYLKADNISLYNVTKTEAMFIETDPNINIFDSDLAIFIRMTQFKYAKRVITIPIEHFHRFAEELGDPAAQVIILSNTGRCGSTLLTQMFEATGVCASISEPYCLGSLCETRKEYTEEEYERALCNSIRIMCKASSKAYSGFVIKTFSMNMGIVPAIVKEMPQVRHLFMYRDMWDTQKSFYRLVMGGWIQRFIIHFIHVLSTFSSKTTVLGLEPDGVDYLGNEKVKQLQQCISSNVKISYTCYVPVASVALYLNFLASGLPIAGVRYEDIKYNGKESMKSIFHYCGLDEDLVSKAMTSLSRDSQRGSSLSRDNVKGNEELGRYEGKNKQIMDVVCNIFGVPVPGENQILPNSITLTRA